MYHPPDIGAEDNVVDEYIQLANLTALPVKLFDPIRTTNRWRLRGAVKFDFPANTTIPAGGTLLVVSFNPATNAAARDQFFFDYDLPDQTALVGPYEGKLDNSSDRIELYKPDDQFSGAAASAVPYILVEQVAYTDQPPWPTVPDGTGFALRRASPSLFANDPANWMSIAPFSSPPDRDYDGLPDSWESQYRLNPDSAADVSQDPDHDGQSNRDEYFAGTDPTNPASRLELKIISLSPVTLEFFAVANKSYTIEFRNSLTAGTWAPLAHVDALPTPRVVRWPDSPGGLRFYRLRTPRVQ